MAMERVRRAGIVTVGSAIVVISGQSPGLAAAHCGANGLLSALTAPLCTAANGSPRPAPSGSPSEHQPVHHKPHKVHPPRPKPRKHRLGHPHKPRPSVQLFGLPAAPEPIEIPPEPQAPPALPKPHRLLPPLPEVAQPRSPLTPPVPPTPPATRLVAASDAADRPGTGAVALAAALGGLACGVSGCCGFFALRRRLP